MSRHHASHDPIDRPVSFTMSGTDRVEPVDLDTVKQHLRFSSDDEDDLLTGWIATARALFEEQTGRQLVNATWQYSARYAPCHRVIELPRTPLYGDVVITYDDANGDEQTFDAANYVVHPSFLSIGSPATAVFDPYCQPGRIELISTASWPVIHCAEGSLRITRTCGYGETSAEIPPIIQAALYLLIGHFHRNRSEIQGGVRQGFEQLPMGAQALMNTFKYTALPTLTDHRPYPFMTGLYSPWLLR